VRQRITDRRVVALIKAFLKAGIFNTETGLRDSQAGTPQGGILSPLLANLALTVLDEHFDRRARQNRALPRRQRQRRPVFRLSRHADDWVLLVKGERADVEQIRRRGGNGPRADGPAPVAGEDNDHPHR
jgi:RNA-directed DNA polymerase